MQTRSLSWSFDFSHELTQVWDVVTNTDRVNRSMGLPAVQYENTPKASGGSKRFGRFKMLGLDLKWHENPYEWVLHQRFSVERDYLSGPLKKMTLKWELQKLPQGCRLTQNIEYLPRNPALLPLAKFQIQNRIRPGFLKFYSQLEKNLRKPFAPTPEDVTPPDARTLKRTSELLHQSKIPETLHARFKELLFESHLPDLVRIRPFSIARLWGMLRETTLTAFLQATKAGIFDLSWDLICPSCRGAKVRTSTLNELKNEAHCDQCNIKFDAQFDRSVELSFTPSASIRKAEAIEYCAGSPQNTRHFLIQQRVAPAGSRDFSIQLDSGAYQIRSLQCEKRYSISVEGAPTSAEQRLTLSFDAADRAPAQLTLAPGIMRFETHNKLDEEFVFTLENSTLQDDACTAAFATSFQDFRELFSTEILRAGQEVSVSSITILFTDLKDSTSLYQKIGDARAFALVNEHLIQLTECVRRNHGAVVKTIGDAVMASFMRPDDAIRAALEIQESMTAALEIKELNAKLAVKIGIHSGPCFVVNRNDRLDYFGTTVNLAARTESLCEVGEILMTGKMLDDPGVKEVLRKAKRTSTQILRTIKGFSEEFELYRI